MIKRGREGNCEDSTLLQTLLRLGFSCFLGQPSVHIFLQPRDSAWRQFKGLRETPFGDQCVDGRLAQADLLDHFFDADRSHFRPHVVSSFR